MNRNVIAALICLLVILVAAGVSSKAAPSGKKRTPTAQALTIPEDQARVIDESRKALADLAAKSPKAKELLDFHDAHAIAAMAEPNGLRVVTEPPKDKPWFFIAADTTPVKMGATGGVIAIFNCQPPNMRLKGQKTSDLVRGLLLAHELSHAVDCLVNHEPPSVLFDEVWLLGELNAHGNVFAILNEWTDGWWKTLVQASQERRVNTSLERGKRPESNVFGQFPEDRAEFVKRFGALDANSMGFFFAQLDIDANITNVLVQMKRYGLPEEDTMGHYLETTSSFYKFHAADIVGHIE